MKNRNKNTKWNKFNTNETNSFKLNYSISTKIKIILTVLLFVGFVIFDWFNGMTYSVQRFSSVVIISSLIIALCLIWGNMKFRLASITFGAIVIAVSFVLGILSSPMLHAKTYSGLIGEIQILSFDDFFEEKEVSFSLVDKYSAVTIATTKIGELSDVSSMFELDSDEFSQINYNGQMVRVAPFKYNSWFKTLINNGSKGVPYYVIINTEGENTNAEAKIVTLENPMKYYPSATLNYNLHRHVASKYKFTFVDDYYFEIDDNGNPYWLIQVVENKALLYGAKQMEALIIVDAVTGEMNKYDLDKIPEWVDTVYPTNMLLTQAADAYTLQNGWFNTVLNKTGMMKIDYEEGSYNYVMLNGEIYLFTGIQTYSSESQATTGLLFISKRTGKAIEMDMPGSSLRMAQSTAVGEIQEKRYTPTTPIIMNIGNHATYVMALKDSSNVVRGYSLVNYQDYTKSATSTTLEGAKIAYLAVLGTSTESIDPNDVKTEELVISEIKFATIEGNSYAFIRFTNNDFIYQTPITINPELLFVNEGTTLKVSYTSTNVITEIIVVK